MTALAQPRKGRPARGRTTRQVGVTLPHELIPFFKKLGGSAWLRRLLEAGARGNWPEGLTLLLDPDVMGGFVAYTSPELFTADCYHCFGEPESGDEDSYRLGSHSTTSIAFDRMDGENAVYSDGINEWLVLPSEDGRFEVKQI